MQWLSSLVHGKEGRKERGGGRERESTAKIFIKEIFLHLHTAVTHKKNDETISSRAIFNSKRDKFFEASLVKHVDQNEYPTLLSPCR